MHFVWSWGFRTWQKSEPDCEVVDVVDEDADEDVDEDADEDADEDEVDVEVDVVVTVLLLLEIETKPPGPSVGSSGKKHFPSFST